MPDLSFATCRTCKQRAPIRLDGTEAFCTACGGKRSLFTTKNVSFAGKPSRWGGKAASIAGVMVLVLGLTLTLSVGLLVSLLNTTAAVALALLMAVPTVMFGGGLLFGGSKLKRHGDSAALETQRQAIEALARHRGGRLMAVDVARSLDIDEATADMLLTELAKDPAADVTLDLDDQGRVLYLFGAPPDPRWRIAEQAAKARIAVPAGQAPRSEIVEDEFLAEAEAEVEAVLDPLAAEPPAGGLSAPRR